MLRRWLIAKKDLRRRIIKINLVVDVGFADVSKYQPLKERCSPYEIISDAKIAIVYIAKINDVLSYYGRWYIASLNNFLKNTNRAIVDIVKELGYNAVGLIDERLDKDLIGKISFRQFAVLAGLGSIGLNRCLIHPRYGPRILIGVVLTNLPIKPDEPYKQQLCTYCETCLKSCPVKAISYETFDRFKCKNRRKIIGKGCGSPCIFQCPLP